MTQGTKSFLFGTHQFILHPLFVIIAFKKYYKKWPKFWQVICILIHDIGIIGVDYLKGDNKRGHWFRGASLSIWLFYHCGLYNFTKGFFFIAGHTSESGEPRSELFIPDKISYLYAPFIWIKLCQWYEGFNKLCTARDWINMVRKNMEEGFPLDNHEIYVRNRDNKEKK